MKIKNILRVGYTTTFGQYLPFLLSSTPLTIKGVATELLGNTYGGYTVPVDTIQKKWICYNAGVGKDTSFDSALIKKYACTIFAFDPTPKSIQYIKNISPKLKNFHFYPIGLWSKDEKIKFYSPINPQHVSHSIHNIQGSDAYFEAVCKRLKTVMRQLHHSHIDLLKLDIEGAEYEVLEDMLKSKIFPTVVCAEFDQPYKILHFIKTLLNMHRHGYRIFYIKGWVYSWLYQKKSG